MHNLLALQRATRAARARTGDTRLSVAVRAGLYQLQRVTPRPGTTHDVQALGPWVSLPAMLAALDSMGA